MPLRLGRACLGSLLIVVVLGGGSPGQRGNYPKPPEPAIQEQAQPETRVSRKLDIVEMARDARELSVLAGSIPGDVDQMKKGLLPKDAVDKLKRIEKLSKHLRAQIQP